MRRNEKGMALVSVVLMLTVLLAMAQVLLEKVWQSTRQRGAGDRREQLFWAAQSGLETARKELAEGYGSSGWQELLTGENPREYPTSPVWAHHSNGHRVEIYLRDNEDGDDDVRHDNDLQIYVLTRARSDAGGETLIESLCKFEAPAETERESRANTSAGSFPELFDQEHAALEVLE